MNARLAVLLCFAVLTFSGCKKALPPDTICTYEPLPATSEVPAGQGAIQVLASTDAYFYVFDSTAKGAGGHGANGLQPEKPGDYTVKLNNSVHPVSVQEKMLTKCSSGAVLSSGSTDENYQVLDNAGTQLSSAHLGSALSLFPANYRVRLNNSEVPAAIKAGATTELKPGTVNLNVATDEGYHVFDAGSKELAGNHVGRALGLFPGAYTVKINNSQAKVDVRAGENANVPVGTLVMQATTDENYSVFDSGGTELASAHLARPMAFVPGNYVVKINHSSAPATVTDGALMEVKAGVLVVQGTTDEDYSVFDNAGTQLAATHLGRPLAFMPGDYHVKINNAVLPVHAETGKTSEYLAGTLTVKSTGTDTYYVLDSAGTQLASRQLNLPISLPAGKYSVKVGNNTKPIALTGGQALVLAW